MEIPHILQERKEGTENADVQSSAVHIKLEKISLHLKYVKWLGIIHYTR